MMSQFNGPIIDDGRSISIQIRTIIEPVIRMFNDGGSIDLDDLNDGGWVPRVHLPHLEGEALIRVEGQHLAVALAREFLLALLVGALHRLRAHE